MLTCCHSPLRIRRLRSLSLSLSLYPLLFFSSCHSITHSHTLSLTHVHTHACTSTFLTLLFAYSSNYHLISHKYHSRALSSLALQYRLSICLRCISLKNITCRLEEEPSSSNFPRITPILFFARYISAPLSHPFSLCRLISLTSTDYRLSSAFLLRQLASLIVSLNLNGTQLNVSANRLLLKISHICFAAPRSSRRRIATSARARDRLVRRSFTPRLRRPADRAIEPLDKLIRK